MALVIYVGFAREKFKDAFSFQMSPWANCCL